MRTYVGTLDSADIVSVFIKYENLIIVDKQGNTYYMRNEGKDRALETLFKGRTFDIVKKRIRKHLILK